MYLCTQLIHCGLSVSVVVADYISIPLPSMQLAKSTDFISLTAFTALPASLSKPNNFVIYRFLQPNYELRA